MARYWFGGTAADFTFAVSPGNLLRLTSATLTFWSAKVGGVQYTDLLVGGQPASQIIVGDDGQVPIFQGPDGVPTLWASGGGGRIRISADPGPLTADAQAAALAAEDAATRAEAVGALADTQIANQVTTVGSATETALTGAYAAKATQTTVETGRLSEAALSDTFVAQPATAPTDGQALVWDATLGEFKGGSVGAANRTVTAGGSPGADAVNIVEGNVANAAASDLGGAVVLGGGTSTQNNVAGGDGSVTVGTETPNAAQAGTGAHYSVVGGYDSVAGGLASIVLGFHNYTGLGSTHGTISGGSFQKILSPSDYGTIGGGSGNTVSGDGATIAGGVNGTASGDHSTIGGGSGNTVSGLRSFVVGGINNTMTRDNSGIGGGSNNKNYGDSSFICGGTSGQVGHLTNVTWGTYSYMGAGLQNLIGTTARAQYAVLNGGRQNSVQKDYGTVLGGRENVVTSRDFGQASGHGAVADKHGQDARSAGYFAAAGDAQTSVLVARNQTTDATPTELFLDGAAWRADIPANTTWAFSVLVAARRTDADGENAAYRIEGCIRKDGAAASTLVGVPTVTTIAEDAAAAGWDVTAGADASGRLVLTATGEAAKTVRWVARTTLTEVAG